MVSGAEKNRILAALPPDVWQRWSHRAEVVELIAGQVLAEARKPPVYVYFPLTAVISMLYVMRNGASAQIAVVGREGVAGIPLLMGGTASPGKIIVQSAGTALRLPLPAVTEEFQRGGPLNLLLLRYATAFIAQISQTAMCYRLHPLEQQLARWLLLSLDRLEDNTLRTTHELIANMLGVRRETVTEGAQKLQALGLIRSSRGRIQVLDRHGLARRSCECYELITQAYAQLGPKTAD